MARERQTKILTEVVPAKKLRQQLEADDSELTTAEENLLRMRNGITTGDNVPLEHFSRYDDATAEKLAKMEIAIFSNRLNARDMKKAKIVAKLKRIAER